MIREPATRPLPGRGILDPGQIVRFWGTTVRPTSVAHSLLKVGADYTVVASGFDYGAIRIRLAERPGFQFLRTMFEART